VTGEAPANPPRRRLAQLNSSADNVMSNATPSFTMRPGVSCPDWSVVQSRVVKDALLAMFEPEHILSQWSGYEPSEDRVGTTVLRLFAEQGERGRPLTNSRPPLD
jgi:hypothetical protein